MALKKSEATVCEAIDTMLRHGVALGLQDLPDDVQKEEEHSFQYLHEQINEMFAIKAAGLTHHDGVCAAFRKIHNYKFITDPTFRRSVDEEMKSQGVPAKECKQVLDYIPAIISEIKKDDWCERDFGFNPNLSEIIKVSQPGVSESTVRENCGMCEEDDLGDEEVDEEEIDEDTFGSDEDEEEDELEMEEDSFLPKPPPPKKKKKPAFTNSKGEEVQYQTPPSPHRKKTTRPKSQGWDGERDPFGK